MYPISQPYSNPQFQSLSIVRQHVAESITTTATRPLQNDVLIKLDVTVRRKADSEISVTDLPTQRPVFDYWPAHVGFVVDQVALGQVFLQLLPFYPIGTVPQMLPVHISFIYHRCNNILVNSERRQMTRAFLRHYISGSGFLTSDSSYDFGDPSLN
jgi:hypothetical protein